MDTSGIRKVQSPADGKWWFSVVDIIALTTSSKNPQNYWKVLKNRLKKTQNELVSKCNQLKMKARDGKSYLTDAADMETLTEIVKLIPGARVNELEACFRPFIETPPDLTPPSAPLSLLRRGDGGEVIPPSPLERAGVRSDSEAELLLDAYETPDAIFIEAFVAGVSMSDLNIEVSPKKIKIEGKRPPPRPVEGRGEIPPQGLTLGEQDYFLQELQWLSFSRTLELPSPVQTEKVETWEERGHLTIRLEKI